MDKTYLAKEKLVSIIIPTYNRQDIVNKAIALLSKQTYKHFEVIVVDDGSSIPIELKKDSGIDVKLFRYSENRGPGYARRIGREQAVGDYICYLDSDDFWSANFLEACVSAMNLSATAGMVFANTVVLKDGQELARRLNKNKPKHIVPKIFQTYNRSWSTSSCLWRNDVSLSEHWFELRNNEDYIHDIYCSRINNNIEIVENTFAYKNQSADNRILREGPEVAKTLNVLVDIDNLASYKGWSFFILNRIYKFNIRVDLKKIRNYFLVPVKEFNTKHTLLKYYFAVLIFNGIFNLKSYKIKSWLKKLKY